MQGKDYVALAMRTNDDRCSERLQKKLDAGGLDIGGVLNGALGLSGEAGEALDMVKKWIFHEQELDVDHLERELGDVMWYMAKLCYSFGFDLDEIMQKNIDKLKARYPEGFDTELSNHRAVGDV